FSDPTLLMPATYLPSHLTRNLKFLYGSKRCVFTLNCGIGYSLHLDLAGHLLELDNHELGGFKRGEADDDIDTAAVDVGLGGRLLVALDEVGIARCRALERPLAKQILHKRADVEADLRPQRLVVRLEDHPLRAAIQALLDEKGRAADGNVLPFRGQAVVTL